MRNILCMAALAAFTAALPVIANAHGCLKGAAVGGVVGHVAGHHGVVGATVGCAVGHHEAKLKERQAAHSQSAKAPARPGPTEPPGAVH